MPKKFNLERLKEERIQELLAVNYEFAKKIVERMGKLWPKVLKQNPSIESFGYYRNLAEGTERVSASARGTWNGIGGRETCEFLRLNSLLLEFHMAEFVTQFSRDQGPGKMPAFYTVRDAAEPCHYCGGVSL